MICDMSEQNIKNPTDGLKQEEKYHIPSLPLPYDLESKEVMRLLNDLFYHFYTKIDHVVANMQVSRQTASNYLDRIVTLGLLQKEKMGKENYYINTRLMNLFIEFGQYKQQNQQS